MKKFLSLALVFCMLFTVMMPASAAVDGEEATTLSTTISGTINSDAVWENGSTVSGVTLSGGTADDPIVITINGTVTVGGTIRLSPDVISYVVFKAGTDDATLMRSADFTGQMFYSEGVSGNFHTLNFEGITLDGGAVWTGDIDATLKRGTVNEGVKSAGSMLYLLYTNTTLTNSVLQNHDDYLGEKANAVFLRYYSSISFVNSVVRNNSSVSGYYSGGVITVRQGGTVKTYNSEIYGNKGTDGGFFGTSSTGSYGGIVEVYSSVFHNNYATNGAIFDMQCNSNKGYLLIDGCEFYDNAAGRGLIYEHAYSRPVTIKNSYFHDNECAVWDCHADPVLELSGKIVIEEDPDYAGYLYETPIVLGGPLAEGSSIALSEASINKLVATGAITGNSNYSVTQADLDKLVVPEGYSLCVVDVNGDGIGDVVPYTYKEGEVSTTVEITLVDGANVATDIVISSVSCLPKNPFKHDGLAFAGWVDADKKAVAKQNFTQPTTLYATWKIIAPVVKLSRVDATLSATVTNATDGITYSYQWYKNNVAIDGATGASYTMTDVNTATYKCVVTASKEGFASVEGNASGSSSAPAIAQIGDVKYATLKDVVAAANATEGGAVVNLYNNVTLGEKLTITGDVTITGAYTITRADNYTGTLFTVNNGATLTLDGGLVIDGANEWTLNEELYNKALNLEVSGVTWADLITSEEGAPNATAPMFKVTGSVVANNVTIQNNYSSKDSNNGDYGVFQIDANATLTMTGATVKHIVTGGANSVAHLSTNSVWTINEGTVIEDTFAGKNGGVCRNDSGKITMNGGSIRNNDSINTNGTVFMLYGGEFIMNDGEICSNTGIAGSSNSRCSSIYLHSSGKMTMKGGAICHNIGIGYGGIDSSKDSAKVTINGGYVADNVSVNGRTTADINIAAGTAVISGGTFKQNVSKWLSPDYKLVPGDDGTYTIGALAGSGTEADPYLICSVEDLILFRNSVNSGSEKYNKDGVYVALAADIDLAGIDWSVNVGDDCNATFDGIFDGQNHTIKNLTSTETAQKADGYICTGLFGAIYGNAVIKNLTLENVTIDTGDYTGNNVGAVVGFAYSANGTIENVKVTGDIKIGAANACGVGTVVGYLYYGNLTIKDCVVNANDNSYINGDAEVGGIIGYGAGADIINCTVDNIDISGQGMVAGVAGLLYKDGKIENCKVENADISAIGDKWVNSAAIAIGSLAQEGTITPDVAYNNVTINGAKSDRLVGVMYTEKPETTVPGIAAVVNNTYYATLKGAVDAANATEGGATVTLISDVVLDEIITVSNNVTITGPYTITRADNYTGTLFVVDDDKTLTLDGGLVIDGANEWVLDEAGFMAAYEAKTKHSGFAFVTAEAGAPRATAAMFDVSGSVVMNKATIQNHMSADAYVRSVFYLNKDVAATLTMNDGAVVKHCATANSSTVASVNSGATFTINDGALIIDNFGAGHGAISRTDYGNIVMTGGTIKNTHAVNTNGSVFMLYGVSGSRATFTMSGGEICSNIALMGSGASHAPAIYVHQCGDMIMTAGSICHNYGYTSGGVIAQDAGSTTLAISGDSFLVNNEAKNYPDFGDLYAVPKQCNITGGTFTSPIITELFADDYKPVYNEGTGTYTIEYDVSYNKDARINVSETDVPEYVYFKTYQEAITYAKANGKQVEILRTITLAKDGTFDLQGVRLNAAESLVNAPVVLVLADVTITNGIIDAAAGENAYAIEVGNNTTAGSLTIAGGTYRGYNTTVYITNGVANISGGVFQAKIFDGVNDSPYILSCDPEAYANGNAKFNVTGGRFNYFNPENNITMGENTNYLVDGYKASDNYDNGKWYVAEANVVMDGNKYFATIKDALAILLSADETVHTVKILKDLEIDVNNSSYNYPILINGFVIELDLNGKTITADWGKYTGSRADNALIGICNGGKLTIIDSVGGGKIINNDDKANVENRIFWAMTSTATKSLELYIKGGTFIQNDVNTALLYIQGNKPSDNLAPIYVEISGGHFETVNTDFFNAYDGFQYTAYITGGTFNTDPTDGEIKIHDDFAIEKNPDGTFGVVNAVAIIGNNRYASLEEAIAAANAMEGGATVKLCQDVALSKALSITRDVTIISANKSSAARSNESANYKITRAAGYTGTLFAVGKNATLTLDGGIVIDGGNAWTFDSESFYKDLNNFAETGSYNKDGYSTSAEGGIVSSAAMITINGTNGAVVMNNATIQNNWGSQLFSVPAGATLTMAEGSLIQNIRGSVAGQLKGTWTMNGGKIIGVHGHSTNGALTDIRGGSFIINGGEICYNTLLGLNNNGSGVLAQVYGTSSKLVVNGGNVHDNANFCPGGGWGCIVYLNNGGNFEMNGGIIENGNSDKSTTIGVNSPASTVALNAGTINVAKSVASSYDSLLYGNVTIGKDMTISGGDVRFCGNSDNTIVINGEVNSNVLLRADNITNNGVVNGDVTVSKDSWAGNSGKTVISGGIWNGKFTVDPGVTLSITGGTFKNDVSAWLAPGFTLVKNDDGTYGVVSAELSKLYRYDNNEYSSIKEVIEAIKENGSPAGSFIPVVEVINSHTVAEEIEVSIDLVLDLNGHQIYATDDCKQVIRVTNFANLTVKDSAKDGAIVNANIGGYAVVLGTVGCEQAGDLTVAGGTLKGYNTAVYVNRGTLIVKGGILCATEVTDLIECKEYSYNNNTAKVAVVGGKFYNWSPEKYNGECYYVKEPVEGYYSVELKHTPGGAATCQESQTCEVCHIKLDAMKECVFVDYVSNNDATCYADGTLTAKCIYNCGRTHTINDVGSKVPHTDEKNHNGRCDHCNGDLCETCGDIHNNIINQWICFFKSIFQRIKNIFIKK